MTIRKCCVCNSVLSGLQKKYCSVECANEGLKKPPLRCLKCNNEFKPIRKSSRFCSIQCYNADKIDKSRFIDKPDSVPGAKWISLTQNKFALVDDLDFDLISKFNWCSIRVRSNMRGEVFYAKRTDAPIYLHRFIMSPLSKDEVDHINGNTLDCRRSNLTICNRSGNGQNRLVTVGKKSGYKGVHSSPSGRWVVRYMHNGKEEYGGTFTDILEAAECYDDLVRRFSQVNSVYNFPRVGERSAITGKVRES